ncbi:hypothetical protein OWV82_013127 [Melia azedarach]|uniref:Uncharacterized protein n=1 Tax=Melia azedarach TaxID=155640 RepID=A0ACC1XUT7_MELAZ|nr:hypothetical protein OWV82_013127 [Melia azedarach]
MRPTITSVLSVIKKLVLIKRWRWIEKISTHTESRDGQNVLSFLTIMIPPRMACTSLCIAPTTTPLAIDGIIFFILVMLFGWFSEEFFREMAFGFYFPLCLSHSQEMRFCFQCYKAFNSAS